MNFKRGFCAVFCAALIWPYQVAGQSQPALEPTIGYAHAISCAANSSALAYYGQREGGDEPSPLAAAIDAEPAQIEQWREDFFAWQVVADALNLPPAIKVDSLITTATFDMQKAIRALKDQPERAAAQMRAFGRDCDGWKNENSVSFGAIPPPPDYKQGELTLEQAVTCAAYTALMAAAIGEEDKEQSAKGEDHQLRWLYLSAARAGGNFDAIVPKVTPQIESMGAALESYERQGNGFAGSLFIFGYRNACRTLRKANADEWQKVDMSVFEEGASS